MRDQYKRHSQELALTPDELPDGINDERYMGENKEWPNLQNRLGQPRISEHYFYHIILDWLRKGNKPEFSYFDAGCGHGNDLRAFRNVLQQGRFLGITLSREEIMRGLEYYSLRKGENASESVKLFGLGDLHDLSQVKVWDNEKKDFSCRKNIENNEFDLIYMEAVLQAAGYGYDTYQKKKDSAQEILGELFRICKAGGKFLGRVTAFTSAISKDQQFDILRKFRQWRFMPDVNGLVDMLRDAGFASVVKVTDPHENSLTDLSRKDIVKVSFLAEK